jgi:CheY-like chemotaxis protein
MDGVEATALIREWEKDKADGGHPVPIVALTANAVTGMREMFIEKGFNDFLAKPIDVSKLDEIIEKWLPKEKQIKSDGGASFGVNVSGGSAELKIPGVDTARGMIASGGTEAMYREVLELYCRDAAARMEFLAVERAGYDMKNFTTQVHALKSASASIGASELSEKAAMLEDAGKRGDMTAISEGLDGFRDDLSLIVERIRHALSLRKDVPYGASVLDKTALPRLKEALEAEDIGAVDGILSELREMRFGGEAADIISGISDCVILSDFKTAADMTAKFLEKMKR